MLDVRVESPIVLPITFTFPSVTRIAVNIEVFERFVPATMIDLMRLPDISETVAVPAETSIGTTADAPVTATS